MRLDRLRTGLLAGPMPMPGAVTDLQFPQTRIPSTDNTDSVIGPESQEDIKLLMEMGKLLGKSPQEMTSTLAQSQVHAGAKGLHEPMVSIGVNPEMTAALGELSSLAQGTSFGRPMSDKDDPEGGDLLDLPSRPSPDSSIADEMKTGPLQQMNFLDPRYRSGGWF